jgi:hypothetical protein
MPAKFSFSFSARWKLAHSRRDDFPASPDFSQLESGRGTNFVRASLHSLAELDRAVRYRSLWRQETEALDSNFQRGSLQLSAKCLNVSSLNRLAASPQNPRTSKVRGVLRVQPRIRFHSPAFQARSIVSAGATMPLRSTALRTSAPQVFASIAHHWPQCSTGRKPPATRDMHHRQPK